MNRSTGSPVLAVWTAVGLSLSGALAPRSAGAEKAPASDDVTFCKQVAPILWKHCAGCHRPGEIGQFSLLSYEDAQKRADFLAEITAQRRMPPWKAAPGFGRFRDERVLSADEVAVIGKWAAAGAPQGNVQDLGAPPQFADGWQLGEPDMVLNMVEPFSVPADGPDIYRCFVIPIELEGDAMVSAAEFRPGNPAVVHHAIMFLDAKQQARSLSGKDGQQGFESFGGPGVVPTGGLGAWAPGAMPRRLPDGIVKYVRRGSDLVLQIHYHPSGKAETDQSSVGLYFSKKPAQRIVSGIAVIQPELKIPPGKKRHLVKAESAPLPCDVHVLGVSPHMHNLGREIKVVAVDPTGRKTAPLLWIKDWDFNWQGSYEFVRPMRLPKGSKIRVQAFYDNSDSNPKNPNHPPKEVTWGEQTSDEMCLVSVQVYTDTEDDLRQIAKLLGHELAAGIEGGVPDESASPTGKSPSEKPLAGKVPAGKPTAPMPQPPAPAAVAEASPADKPAEKPAKKPAGDALVVPPGGLPIAENIRPLFGKLDLNGDGVMSQDEVDKLPVEARSGLIRNLKRASEKAK
jgi:hypothetical protein